MALILLGIAVAGCQKRETGAPPGSTHSCPEGKEACGGTCCPEGRACIAGTCACPAGVECGGTCIDPLTSIEHCGASGTCAGDLAGTVCAVPLTCRQGSCACPDGQVLCDGACVDPLTDEAHCGALRSCEGASGGRACGAGQTCTNGACRCDAPLLLCDGACIDPRTSRVHCGARRSCLGPDVGEACKGTVEACVEGECAGTDPSLAGLELSEGTLLPAFSPLTTSYQLEVPGALGTLEVIAVPVARGAQMTVNGELAAPGTTVPIALQPGSATAVLVEVRTRTGAVRTYRIAVVRAPTYVKPSNTVSFDRDYVFRSGFGASVALSGDTMAVGWSGESGASAGIDGDQEDQSAPYSGAAYVFRLRDRAWRQEAYVKASDAVETPGGFGRGVAIDGNTLVVGGAGKAYVFVRDGATWTEQAQLTAPLGNAGDGFGLFSVAVSGDTIAVGAYLEDGGSPGIDGDELDRSVYGSGAVYVFSRTAGSWSREAYIKADVPAQGAAFGGSVALSGDLLAVGANSEGGAGAAYVFLREGGSWSQEAYIKSSNSDPEDAFGWSVALDGDTLAVGAYGESSSSTEIDGDQDDNSAHNAGAVYVFTRAAGAWTQQAYLKASNAAAADAFGVSVSVQGDRLLVGAPLEDGSGKGAIASPGDDNAPGSGAAYLFERSGNVWTQINYVKASNTESGDDFGSAVSIDGALMCVGAPLEDSAARGIDGAQGDFGARDSGAVYVY